MLKNYNTSAKKNSTDISNGFISDITRKVEKEPAWLKDISKNLIYESEVAGRSGIESRIAEANKRLESFSIDLDGFNNMPSDRKGKSHIVEFTKERYKPLVTEEPIDPDFTVPESNANYTLESRVKPRLPKIDKYGRIQSGVSNLLNVVEPDEKNYSPESSVYSYRGNSYNEPETEKFGIIDGITGIKDKVADTVGDIADRTKDKLNSGKRWAKKTIKSIQNETIIKKDSGYVASYETGLEDYSDTYGVTILRDVEDHLGIDSENSRKNATIIVENNKDAIIDAGKRYGVDPINIAGCIFTEQACNITMFEDEADEILYKNEKDPSIGIGQIKISTAKELEESGLIQRPIEKIGIGKWKVPGVGIVEGSYNDAIKKRLDNPSQNVEYVAAYCQKHQNEWKKHAGVDLYGNTAVIATLYNIGKSTRGYNSNPQPNDFGRYTRANYGHLGKTLGIIEVKSV